MDKRINCNDCPLCHVEVEDYCERYCSDMADFIEEIRAKVIEECMDVVPCRIDDGDYSDGFNACSKKVLDKLQQLKEQNNDC